jgi:two-component system OmpR family sensor kinase
VCASKANMPRSPAGKRRRSSADGREDSEADLHTRIEHLETAVQARDAFIALVAHELRNPMTPIRGQVELLQTLARNEGASSRLVERLARLQLAVESYIRRATTLLETTRLAAGHLRLYPAQLNLSALVHELVEAYRPAATRAGCVLRASIEEDVSGFWDRVALEQITENLLSNALKYGAGAPVEVSLATEHASARLVVRDHGPGIAEEHQQRIFAPFEQVALGSERRAGFGIGLWVVRQLIEAMNGSIEVTSVGGEGSAFTVHLPRGGTVGGEQA